MNQEEIMFDDKRVPESLDTVKEKGLRKILENFGERTNQISSGNTIALNVMNRGLRHYKIYRYWLEECVKIPNYDKKNPDHKKQLDKLIFKRFENEMDKNFEQALQYVQAFRKEDDEFKRISYLNSLNSIVNVWTTFESSIKELWIYCVDNYPKIFINGVLRHQDNTEITGVSGKNISISLLAKYDFNISKIVGQIMNSKFDFTNISGIKKAFQALLDESNISLKSLDEKYLNQLEITRHLIVHKAGIIDENYLKRTIKTDENIGELINLSEEEMRNFGNSCISPIIELVKDLDNMILNNSSS